MGFHYPNQLECFHGCDKEIGMEVLNGKSLLNPSDNKWDWLGPGTYFWEHNPIRALEYAQESAAGEQFSLKKINSPFVLGAIIQLGNCLNLAEPESLQVLEHAYRGLKESSKEIGKKLYKNEGNNRMLDCSVIKYIHHTRKAEGLEPYDTIRAPFIEGENVYPGANFTKRNHLQICVLNPKMIKGYFLPLPIAKYNPGMQ